MDTISMKRILDEGYDILNLDGIQVKKISATGVPVCGCPLGLQHQHSLVGILE